jgi:hypothetical protein
MMEYNVTTITTGTRRGEMKRELSNYEKSSLHDSTDKK